MTINNEHYVLLFPIELISPEQPVNRPISNTNVNSEKLIKLQHIGLCILYSANYLPNSDGASKRNFEREFFIVAEQDDVDPIYLLLKSAADLPTNRVGGAQPTARSSPVQQQLPASTSGSDPTSSDEPVALSCQSLAAVPSFYQQQSISQTNTPLKCRNGRRKGKEFSRTKKIIRIIHYA